MVKLLSNWSMAGILESSQFLKRNFCCAGLFSTQKFLSITMTKILLKASQLELDEIWRRTQKKWKRNLEEERLYLCFSFSSSPRVPSAHQVPALLTEEFTKHSPVPWTFWCAWSEFLQFKQMHLHVHCNGKSLTTVWCLMAFVGFPMKWVESCKRHFICLFSPLYFIRSRQTVLFFWLTGFVQWRCSLISKYI